MENPTIRLNKFLAGHGFDARRKINAFLQQNEVKLNGSKVTEPGVRLDPSKDKVTINGQTLVNAPELVYFLLNKPKGVISSVNDEHGRPIVIDLIKTRQRIFPVGRLDENTTGALILTNDGELTQKLTHPKFHIDKTYLCLVAGKVKDPQIAALQTGIDLKEGKTLPSHLEILEQRPGRTVLQLTIHEGRNHQIKRMLSKIGLELLELKRTNIGSLSLENLPVGESRALTIKEINQLKH